MLLLAPLSVLAMLTPSGTVDGSIPFKKFTLDNGLEVIVHEDHSDPVVAVYLYYHVGSAREVPGRSGFAHLFEHMLFQGSEHVGDDQHFKLVSEAGGTLNGSTTRDRTNYFEVLPVNQLELALWLESDRMGFLLPSMTQAKLDNQRDVVKNERRQNYENRPYGMASTAIAAAMYPPDHPYHWLTIGSQEDLTAASLDDVKGFFRRWYGPNNATLAIGGDVKADEVLALVKKYFGGLPRGPEVAREKPRPATLKDSIRLVQEDHVKLAQLEMNWPGVEVGAADEPALDFLASILAQNRSSVLEKALRVDSALASQVSASNGTDELAGEFSIVLRPTPGTTLDTLEKRTHEILVKLAADGVDAAQLERVKSRYEAGRIRRLETVQGKTNQLANDNVFMRDPGWVDADIKRHLAVTAADVTRVLKQYVLDRSAVVLSIVPMGKTDLAAADSKPVPTEARAAAAAPDKTVEAPAPAKVAADPLDRTKKPGAGAAPAQRFPAVWHAELPGGVKIVGTPYRELPMTSISLSVAAGRMSETAKTLGLASITAEMMQQGTKKLSSNAFQEELDRLGASINASAGDEEMTFSLSVLDKHRDEAVALLADVLLQPRFADEDFQRVKRERLVAIDTRGDQIRAIAGEVYRRLLWGGDSYAGLPSLGTKESVTAFTRDDVEKFWRANVSPVGARLAYVGALDADGVKKLLQPLAAGWKSAGDAGSSKGPAEAAAKKPTAPAVADLGKTRIYLVDKPGAAQSEIRIGRVSVASTDATYYPLTVLNHILGGTFSSRVNMNLREDKGYTYGARTAFEGGLTPGAFTASAAVKTDVTKESVVEFMKELAKIRDGLTPEELTFAKDALRQSATRQYESTMAMIGYLENVSRYGWPDDYGARRMQELAGMKGDDLKKLAQGEIRPDAMAILVVGDKAKVGKGLAELGYGDVIELDIDGTPIK